MAFGEDKSYQPSEKTASSITELRSGKITQVKRKFMSKSHSQILSGALETKSYAL